MTNLQVRVASDWLDGNDIVEAWRAAGYPPRDFNRVPFAAASLYNQTFAQRFGSNDAVPIHPDSDLMVEALRRQISFSTGALQTGRYFKLTSDVNQFTMACYVVEADWTLATVRYSGTRGEASDTSTTRFTGGGTLQVPMPPERDLRPAPPNINWDSNSDSQVIIWDRDNVLEHADGPQFWDFWQCAQEDTGELPVAGEWRANVNGEFACVNCSHFTGELTSSGIPSSTPSAYPSRGAGVPYIAGLVREWEMTRAVAAQGKIGHALAFAYSSPDDTFSFPASKSDGAGPGQSEVAAGQPFSGPEGQFFKLAEWFDIDSLGSEEAKVAARTLRDHGMCAIDNSGRTKFYFEAAVSAGWDIDVNLVGQIPLEAFIAVDFEGGDTGRSEATPGWGTGSETFSAGLSGGIVGTPAVLGTVVGSTVALASNAVVSASLTPLEDELLLFIGAMNNNEDGYFTNVNGAGMVAGWGAGEWRSLIRRGIYATGNRNLTGEVQVARAPASAVAGEITGTSRNPSQTLTVAKALQVLRVTADARPTRVACLDCQATRSTTPSVRLKASEDGALLLGVLLSHRGLCNDDAAGWTANVRNTAPGAPNNPHVSTFTRTGDGDDVVFAPTLTTSGEWIAMIVEIT